MADKKAYLTPNIETVAPRLLGSCLDNETTAVFGGSKQSLWEWAAGKENTNPREEGENGQEWDNYNPWEDDL